MDDKAIRELTERIIRLEIEWAYADGERDWSFREAIGTKLDTLKRKLSDNGIDLGEGDLHVHPSYTLLVSRETGQTMGTFDIDTWKWLE